MLSPRAVAAALPLALVLCACNPDADGEGPGSDFSAAAKGQVEGADSMASRDPAQGASAEIVIPDSEPRPVMQSQVVLERLGFATGVIDGRESDRFARALTGFQEARGLTVTGELDEATRAALGQWSDIPATRVVMIPEDWAQDRFVAVPEDMTEQAERARLGYESMAEKLAERFHTTPAVLAQLNPGGRPAGAGSGTEAERGPAAGPSAPAASHGPAAGVRFRPGRQLRVPNVGADAIDPGTVDNPEWLATLRSLGVGTAQPEAARIVVDESEGWLKAYDDADQLIAMFSVTTGSEHDPLPIGDWTVKGVAYNPPFAFDPALFWDVPDSEEKQRLPPGPNSPVGVVWIDLTKEHYGIHGTPVPESIGRSESHGCVRLTNWDAARLAQMVGGGTEVLFQK
jgi:lipoprotein-anchoring transpeptidase ErfK/SrfK